MTDQRNYLSGAVRHYSSLFSFPSYHALIGSMSAIAMATMAAAFMTVTHAFAGFLNGIAFAFSVFISPTICSDLVTSRLSRDTVFSLRRWTALSAVTTSVWALIVLGGALIDASLGILGQERAFFLGASLIMGFRFLVVRSMTLFRTSDLLVAVVLQPGFCAIAASAIWGSSYFLILAMLFATLLLVSAGTICLRVLDGHGEKKVGIGSVRLFRGFISDWLASVADPLEDLLEEIAVPTDASASILGFSHSSEINSLIVVSDIHPGPFRNVGSSNLPNEIELALQGKAQRFVAVPHGASGHERDLASRSQRSKVIAHLKETMELDNFSSSATTMVRSSSGRAHASCQFLGNIAFVTLTCAPDSMEDIPFELGEEIRSVGKSLGAEEVIVIDAHNSIGLEGEVPILSPEQLRDLKSAATMAIRDGLTLTKTSLRFGSHRVVPKELGLRDGLGPGGIAVAVLEVQNRTAAYVILDGNNMARGLREQVMEALRGIVDEVEVLATDTHAVNAVSMVERGYHPVGEVGSREVLLSHIKSCTSKAVSLLAESRFAFRRIHIPQLLMIGEERLRELSLLVDSSVRLFKYLTALVYGPSVFLATLPFFLVP